MDNLSNYAPLPLPLSFYTEAVSLERLLPQLALEQSPLSREQYQKRLDEGSMDELPRTKFTALNEAIVELVEEFALVGFETLAVEDRKSMAQLVRAIDRAGGYAFGGVEGTNESVWQVAVREGGGGQMDIRDIEERWVDRKDEFDEMERKEREQEIKAVTEQPSASRRGTQDLIEASTSPRDSGIRIVRPGQRVKK